MAVSSGIGATRLTQNPSLVPFLEEGKLAPGSPGCLRRTHIRAKLNHLVRVRRAAIQFLLGGRFTPLEDLWPQPIALQNYVRFGSVHLGLQRARASPLRTSATRLSVRGRVASPGIRNPRSGPPR